MAIKPRIGAGRIPFTLGPGIAPIPPMPGEIVTNEYTSSRHETRPIPLPPYRVPRIWHERGVLRLYLTLHAESRLAQHDTAKVAIAIHGSATSSLRQVDQGHVTLHLHAHGTPRWIAGDPADELWLLGMV